MIIADGSDSFPSDDLSDWVSYGLQVSIMRVISEEEIPITPEETERGEGLIGRNVTLHTERVIWAARKASVPQGDITLQASGWIVHDGQRRPFRMRDAPRLEVGQAYIMPITQIDGEWSLLSPSSVVPLSADGSAVPQAETSNKAAAAMAGMTPDLLADRLAHTNADPLALKHWNRPPYERARAVIDEQQPTD